MTDVQLATGPTVDASTDVVRGFDGATLSITVRVYFKTTPQPEATVRTAVSDWFHYDGEAQQLVTVSKFVNDHQPFLEVDREAQASSTTPPMLRWSATPSSRPLCLALRTNRNR